MSDNAHDLKIPSLCVTAVGSGACSAVERLASLNPEIAAYIGIDCWGTNLPLQQIQHKIYLGSDHNQMYGCGGNPQVGQLATGNAFREIYQAVEGYPIVIIVGCMGGGCASGGAHIVARIAKSQGASVISLVTAPFQFEGSQRSLNAANGIQNFRNIRILSL